MGSAIRCERLGRGNFSLSRDDSLALAKKCAKIGIEYYLKIFPGMKEDIAQDKSLRTESKVGKTYKKVIIEEK